MADAASAKALRNAGTHTVAVLCMHSHELIFKGLPGNNQSGTVLFLLVDLCQVGR